MNKHISIDSICTNKVDNIGLEINELSARHYEYVEYNELHVASLENRIHNLVVSVRVLSAGLFSSGIALFALIYYLLTM